MSPRDSMPVAAGTMSSMALVTGATMLVRVTDIAGLVVLARLLSPSDFGAVGLALVVVNVVNLFSQFGVGSAVIQTDVEPRRAGFNAFVTIVAIGLPLTVAAASLSGVTARALGHPELGTVFLAMTLLIPIQTFGVVPTSLLLRDQQFGRQAVTQLVGAVVKLGVAAVLALLGFGLWSLVAGHVIGMAANTGCTFVLCSQRGWLRPRLWDRELAVGLARFGSPLMANGLARQVYNNLDDIIMGSAFGTASLGFYRHAYRLANLPVDGITHAVNTVLLPGYSRLKDQPERIGRAFLGAIRVLALVISPVAVCLWLFSDAGVVIALGERWRPVAPMLRVLSVVALVRPISGMTGPLFTAVGRPGLNLRTAMVQLAALPVLIALLWDLGPMGIAAAVAGTFLAGLVHNVHQVVRHTDTGVTARQFVSALAPALTASALMLAVVGPTLRVLGGRVDVEHPAMVVLFGVLAMAVYVPSMWMLDRASVRNVLRLLRRRRQRPGPEGRSAPLPDDGLRAVLDAWATRSLTGPVRDVTTSHLSGWKHHGAFRVEGTGPAGEGLHLVWKEGRYDAAAIPALDGLPVRPGPPEFAVYTRATGALRTLAPVVHHAEQVEAGRSYRYLLEDLAVGHVRLQHPELARRTADVVATVQAAMGHDVDRLRPWLLEYDDAFSLAVPDYAIAGLHLLRSSPDHDTPALGDERAIRDLYARALAVVREQVPRVAIHGDLNPTNVWRDRLDPDVVRVVDWEWAGIGLPHVDLVAALKRSPANLEEQAVARFNASHSRCPLALDQLAYAWCKLQRYLLDAGFFAHQLALTEAPSPRLDLARHVERSVLMVQDCAAGLATAMPTRSPVR